MFRKCLHFGVWRTDSGAFGPLQLPGVEQQGDDDELVRDHRGRVRRFGRVPHRHCKYFVGDAILYSEISPRGMLKLKIRFFRLRSGAKLGAGWRFLSKPYSEALWEFTCDSQLSNFELLFPLVDPSQPTLRV